MSTAEQFRDQLGALIERVEQSPDLTVVVFRSDKPGYFMAHWDFLAGRARLAVVRLDARHHGDLQSLGTGLP